MRESDLYAIDEQAAVAPMLDALIEGLDALQIVVGQMVQRHPPADLTTHMSRKSSSRVRQLYQLPVAELFNQRSTSM